MPKPKGETLKDILARCPRKAKEAVRITIFTSVWDAVKGDTFLVVMNPLTEATFTLECNTEIDRAWECARTPWQPSALELKRLIHREVQARGIADLPERRHAIPVATCEQAPLFA